MEIKAKKNNIGKAEKKKPLKKETKEKPGAKRASPSSSPTRVVTKGGKEDLSSLTRPPEAGSVKKAGKVLVEKEVEAPKPKLTKYLKAIGRRKTSVARVRLFTRPSVAKGGKEINLLDYPSVAKGGKEILINNKTLEQYFPSFVSRQVILSPLEIMGCLDKFTIQVVLKGGGFSSQAEAVRHGISRALVLFNPDFRKRLKKSGFLTRDPRMRERKKPGLKRARKAPQWAKR